MILPLENEILTLDDLAELDQKNWLSFFQPMV